MKPSEKHSVTNEVAILPKARIDTMEESYILKLREFLSTQGCEVSVNDRAVRECEYHIIIGDKNFVKRIVEETTFTTKKVLIISWEPIDERDFKHWRKSTKIVLIDPTPLSEKEIKQIFAFFITGSQKILTLQTEQKIWKPVEQIKPRNEKPEEPQTARENAFPNLPWRTVMNQSSEQQHVSDEKRISSVIETLYEPPHQNASSHHTFWTFRRLVFVTGMTTLFLVLFPFLWYLLMMTTTSLSLLRFSTCIEKGNTTCAKVSLSVAKHGNSQRKLVAGIVHPFVSFVFGKDTVFTYERVGILFNALLDLGQEMNSGAGIITQASSFFNPSDTTKAQTSAVFIDSMKKIMPSIRTNLDLSIGAAALLADSHTIPFSFPLVKTKLQSITEQMKSYRKIVNMAEQGISLYPVFAGFKGTQKVLFLLENSSELRPTGGFIGSVARANITDGKISDFQIHDVYTFDGQLKGHVDPPQTLKDAWGQEHWYLRDSNWNPDFRESAKSAMWFYEKETGERVDSVIAITTSLLVRLLSVTGPIDLPGYNDRISAENFYAKSLYYTQTDFFPGSTQKKDFLGALAEALLTKIQSGKHAYAIGVGRAITQSLLSHDILLYVSDPAYENAITGIGWGGNVPSVVSCSDETTDSNTTTCHVSSVAINEANISVNKVNSFIERNQKRFVTVSQAGEIKEKIDRTIRNTSKGELGSGPYTVYVRFLVPSRMSITEFTIDGIPVPTRNPKAKKQTLPYGELDTTTPGLTTIAVVLTIPPSEQRSLSLSFVHPGTLSEVPTTILFTEQKQPGVDDVPSLFQLYVPKNIHVNAYESGVPILAKDGGFEYNNNLTSDTEIRTEMTKSL